MISCAAAPRSPGARAGGDGARARSRGTLLTELKAVDPGYPLYGRIETAPGGSLDELLARGGAVVEASVLTRLGLAVGDALVIGDGTFTVTGVVQKEPTAPRRSSPWARGCS